MIDISFKNLSEDAVNVLARILRPYINKGFSIAENKDLPGEETICVYGDKDRQEDVKEIRKQVAKLLYNAQLI